jgi:hypothetical protein
MVNFSISKCLAKAVAVTDRFTDSPQLSRWLTGRPYGPTLIRIDYILDFECNAYSLLLLFLL